LILDPWQVHALDVALGERADGRWSAFEVGVCCPRQNGKGAILEARELAGLFLFDEQLILHSAHEFKTAQEAFRRVLHLVENTDHLRKRVARIRTSHGEEGIELTNGARLRFVARSTSSGRGFSAQCVILDEAMVLGTETMGALLPTLAAQDNPQVWYASSAPLATSVQLHAVRNRALAGGDDSLAYMEWSAAEVDDPDDPEVWATANPSMGTRIAQDYIERERLALPDDIFRRERLGIPDAPVVVTDDRIIEVDIWRQLEDERSTIDGRMSWAIDITPDRRMASIAVAGRRSDGLIHVEVVEHRPGTSWIPERLRELLARWGPSPVTIDPGSPAGSLVVTVRERGIEVREISARQVVQSTGQFYDLVHSGELRHLGQPPLTSAVDGATRRPLGESWTWNRRAVSVDICPLMAATLALGAFLDNIEATPAAVISLSSL
jgi:phage terminase large subunit-like protein